MIICPLPFSFPGALLPSPLPFGLALLAHHQSLLLAQRCEAPPDPEPKGSEEKQRDDARMFAVIIATLKKLAYLAVFTALGLLRDALRTLRDRTIVRLGATTE